MPFTWLSAAVFHRIPQLDEAPKEIQIHFDDAFGTENRSFQSPLTGSVFFLDHSENPQPAPKYDYDETGVVIKGTLVMTDEMGKEATLTKGDIFLVHRGSTMTFSTPKYALAFKAAARRSNSSKF